VIDGAKWVVGGQTRWYPRREEGHGDGIIVVMG